ncbi:hypothetical protein ACH4NF_13930 [Streptomyces sp. NPDC017248]|uniref:hypothetical protein n=1 Tax=unclassified Streptomyces TaxID=2593676 RepID=UPI0037B5D12E
MRKLLPLVLTGLFAVSACQIAGDDDADDTARGLNTMKSFPLQAYLPDPASGDGKTVSTAQWILARQCMVRLGFTGFRSLDVRTVESTYPVRQGTVSGRSKVGDDTPYGVDDPDLAAEYGYHNRREEDSAEQPMEWPADQYTALTGVFEAGESHQAHGHAIPRGGCTGEATRQLFDAEPEAVKIDGTRLTGPYTLAMYLWSDARQRAKKDAAWKKADRAWSDCMKDKGFRYPDPDEASVDTDWFGTGKPSAKEKKTASADARCKLDTDYIQTVHALESRAQKSAITGHRKALEARRTAYHQAVTHAHEIITDKT